jgi:hypothetical protein
MTRTKLIALALVAALPAAACAVDTAPANQFESNEAALVQIQGTSCVALLAGQSTVAGSVCSSLEDENLKVTYSTIDGWTLTGAHLWAGVNLAGVPQTASGNPKVGNFPYNAGTLADLTSYSFEVPLSTFGLSSTLTECAPVNAYVVSHAVVRRSVAGGTYQTETAYGEGTRLVQKGNWATWFSITLTCTGDEPRPAVCETAFAYGGDDAVCFLDTDVIDTSRWGWFNGPLAAGSYSFDLYAGAGQCDLSKGTLVGQVSVDFDGATAQVSYSMGSGFTLDETHLYVGAEPLPRKNGEYTVAPGQYGNVHTLTAASSDSFTVSGLSGSVYVVAHAVACSTAW